MINWVDLSSIERDELIAEKVLGWKKKDDIWYKNKQIQQEEELISLPLFSSDPATIWIILSQFDTYQVTKMFPQKYRTIIQANKHVCYSTNLNESVCKAALKAMGILIN